MDTLKWFEEHKHDFDIEYHDEGGYQGIDEGEMAKLLDAHAKSLSESEDSKIEELKELLSSIDDKDFVWSDAKSDVMELVNKLKPLSLPKKSVVVIDERECRECGGSLTPKEIFNNTCTECGCFSPLGK